MKNLFRLYLLILLGGCASASLSVKKGYNFDSIQNVGVLDFDTPFKKKGGPFGQSAADLFSSGMLEVGFNVVERSKISKVVEELKLEQSGIVDPNSAKEVGKMAGLDAVILGSLTPSRVFRAQMEPLPFESSWEESKKSIFSVRRRRRSLRNKRLNEKRGRNFPTKITVTAKMIHVESGEILWVASAQKDSQDPHASIKRAIKSIIKKLKRGIR